MKSNLSPVKNKTIEELKNKVEYKDLRVFAQGIKENHTIAIKSLQEDKFLILDGCAGTGKTFMALNVGLQKVLLGMYSSIVIVRNTVPVRDNGFLPGTLEEKTAPYEAPYQSIIQESFNCFHPEFYSTLKAQGIIKFKSSSYNQGITEDNAFIIVDEAQNFNYEELYNSFTRVGKNTVIHYCGDYKKQTFLKKEISGFTKFIDVVKSRPSLFKHFEHVTMTTEDIVRSEIIKEFVIADYEYIDNNNKNI